MTDRRAALEAQFATAAATLAKLQQIDPILLDVSLREPCFSAYLGHTLEQKLQILPLVDQFGFKDRIVATFDYQDPTHPQVEDQFLTYLNAHGYDLTGSFALSAVGTIDDGVFVPDLSMQKVVEHGIPNTLHEIYLLPNEDPTLVLQRITASVSWLRANMTGDHGGAPRIVMNVVDLPDAFFVDRDWAFAVLDLLTELDVTGLSFEDARGTCFPFQIGAIVRAAKAVLGPSQTVLFHCHAGNGMENASAIEALLAGADGYWAGMEKESSTIGHASLGELIANLVRAGNENMAKRFQIDTLLPVVHAMHEINHNRPTPRTWPIAGRDAYKEMYSGFNQVAGRPMDLPPELIGGSYSYRIAPDGSDVAVIQGRVAEVSGTAISEYVANRMILLMREDLMAGIRIAYDQPANLHQLLLRAQTRLGLNFTPASPQ
jgi:isopropylmalate/homocitrate/citramalate synthase